MYVCMYVCMNLITPDIHILILDLLHYNIVKFKTQIVPTSIHHLLLFPFGRLSYNFSYSTQPPFNIFTIVFVNAQFHITE